MEKDSDPTRRQALVAGGIAGVATVTGVTAVAGTLAGGATASRGGTHRSSASGPAELPGGHGRDGAAPSGKSARMPVVFFPHGGGPWPFVKLGFPQGELDEMSAYLQTVPAVPRTAPKAVLVISAHWEEARPTVMTATRPPMLYDYYGFPPEAYQVTWPAPGQPQLAQRVRHLLHAAGIESGADDQRGFDHGTFVPLKLMYPAADIPTVQLSLKAGLDPREHLALGRAMAPLRDEGVFIMGSGMTFHNLRAFGDPRARETARLFDDWLRASMVAAPSERDHHLAEWSRAPAARQCHPREEHLMPLLVAAGAAGTDRASLAFSGTVAGLAISGYQFG